MRKYYSELSHFTRTIENCAHDALFDERFEWPVASDVQVLVEYQRREMISL